MQDAYKFVVDELPGVLNMSSASRGKDASARERRVVVAGASAGTFTCSLPRVALESRGFTLGWRLRGNFVDGSI